jgi:hypothetical protein
MNNNGDVAFRYELANGTSRIAVARIVPEPASLALLVIGLLALPWRRHAATTSSFATLSTSTVPTNRI